MGNNSSKNNSQTLGDVRGTSITKPVTNKSAHATPTQTTVANTTMQVKKPAEFTEPQISTSPQYYPTEPSLVVPERPENLGDALKLVDSVKEAAKLEKEIDAEQLEVAKKEGLPLREGRYSVYNSAVAHSRVPSVACSTDCVREAQTRFRDAQYVLRCQRNRTVPCNACSEGNFPIAFENNVRAARTNDTLLRREQRTMQANLQARSRLANSRSRPSTLLHIESTTSTSDAALPLATLNDKVGDVSEKIQAANQTEDNALLNAATRNVLGATRDRPSRAASIKTMHMYAQAPSDCDCAIAPVVRYQQ